MEKFPKGAVIVPLRRITRRVWSEDPSMRQRHMDWALIRAVMDSTTSETYAVTLMETSQ